ncbi:MAG: glutamate dehydrogenase [Parcubacteria group bacterium Gr01-1014_29]|nr:MAG: glutamate dehydrogenase [Parcubacteria group bacterium Gr01-1014_29]
MLERMLAQEIKWCEAIRVSNMFIKDCGIPRRVFRLAIRPILKGEKDVLEVFRVHDAEVEPGEPVKGGIRFHPGVTVELLQILARDMSKKCVLAGLPFGGAKGGVPIDPAQYTRAELRDIAEKTAEELFENGCIHPDYDVPGPDMGVDSEIIFWMLVKANEANRRGRRISNIKAAFTGKSIKDGGVPGRDEATARGGLIALEEYLRLSCLFPEKPKLAVQGFGNVGRNVARLASQAEFNYPVIAVSDKQGGLYAEHGLDIPKVLEWVKDHKTLVGYPHADAISNADLLLLPVDVLVPAALENQITINNASAIRAKFILELANEAITPDAYDVLADRNIPTLPGIVANSGGVIVSYSEWSRNRGKRWHEVDLPTLERLVRQELKDIIERSVQDVFHRSRADKRSLYATAHIKALELLYEKFKRKHE